MSGEPKDQIIWHQSGVNQKGEPFIQLLLNDKIIVQMTPEEARDHARRITEIAESSEQDAFLVDFARKKLGMKFEEAGIILVAFREFRRRTTDKAQGPVDPKDWVVNEDEGGNNG